MNANRMHEGGRAGRMEMIGNKGSSSHFNITQQERHSESCRTHNIQNASFRLTTALSVGGIPLTKGEHLK